MPPVSNQPAIDTRIATDSDARSTDAPDVSGADASSDIVDISVPIRHHPPTPLLPVAIGLIAGILLDRFFAIPIPLGIAACAVAAFAAWHPSATRSSAATWIATAVVASGLGAIRHGWADRHLPADHISRVFDPNATDPMLVTLQGEILDEPLITQDTRGPAYRHTPTTRFTLQARQLAGHSGHPVNVSGRVAVTIHDAAPGVTSGETVQMTGWLSRPRGPVNPGAFDWSLYLRREGILARLTCDHAASVRVVQPAASRSSIALLQRLRSRVQASLLHGAFDASDESGGIIAAVVLGQRSAVGTAMNTVFLRTGCTHFLAASGMNVAWLALLAWGVMRLAGAGYRTTAVSMCGLLVLYLMIAEPQASILRAVVIGLLGCVSLLVRGRPNSLNWLACSAIVILLIDPFDLFRPGFQLSFISVIAVVHIAPRLLEAWDATAVRFGQWRHGTTIAFTESASRPISAADLLDPFSWRRFGRFALQALKLGTFVSIAAWLAAAPLSAWTFDQFTPLGWLWTQILLLPAFLATLIGFVKLVIDLLIPASSVVTGPILAATTHWMTGWATVLSRMPGTLVSGRSPSVAWVICAYALLAIWTWRPHWLRRRWMAPLGLAIILAWWLIPPRWTRTDRDALTVWMLAVGDGTGTLIELPDGHAILYDFGTRSGLDASQVARDALRERGIDHIDAIFVSHTDADHFNAIESIADQCRVDRLVINDHFEVFARQQPSAAEFLAHIRARGIPIATLHGPGTLDGFGGAKVEILWPPRAAIQSLPDANDTSTVLRLTWQGRSIVLTGDISEAAMAGLAARHDLHADALALPHHGAVVSTTAAFIAAVAPRVAIRSSGQRRALTTNGIETLVGKDRYLNTADVGCVKLTIRNGAFAVQTPWRN